MNLSLFLLCLLTVNPAQAFQTFFKRTKSYSIQVAPIARTGRFNPIKASDEDVAEGLGQETPTEDLGGSKTAAESLGFDTPTSSSMQAPLDSGNVQTDRLRKSLDDSAKFKIRNDARFTWLSTLLVSGSYAYGCLAPEGQEFLDILGIPNGGIAGGLGGIAFSLVSIFLFFAPELFAAKRK